MHSIRQHIMARFTGLLFFAFSLSYGMGLVVSHSIAGDIIPVPISKPSSPALSSALAAKPHSSDDNLSDNVAEATGTPPSPFSKPLSNGINGLSAKDSALYKAIFMHQQNGDWDKADQEMAKLEDLLLRGHVLYQRFMHPAKYHSSFAELRGWMDLYADHPSASKIYNLALSRAPKNNTMPLTQPVKMRMLRGVHSDLRDIQAYSLFNYIDNNRSAKTRAVVRDIGSSMQKHLKKGRATVAYKALKNHYDRKELSALEFAHLQAQIAATFLHLGYWDKAEQHAKESVQLSKGKAALGGWVAGLIAWKKQDYGPAAAYFERAATAPEASPWTIAAGGYWAARAHMRTSNFSQVTKWLQIAAQHQRTFYGILAIRAMGGTYQFNWDTPDLTPALQRQLLEHKSALRAMALMQADQVHLAEEELKYIHPGHNEKLQRALLAYAHSINLPAYQMRFASIFKSTDDKFYDAALFPLAPWKKQRKTNRGQIDTAVLNAFIRQESRFRAGAENPSGATGLMQLMPSTANYVMGTKRFEGAGRERLKDPALNMQIGETYIYNLLNQDVVGNDLFSLAIAYNAGPGNLRRWKEERARENSPTLNDPLFFIETIPMSETRSFVERVMTNIWIYRMQLGQPTPSLNAVAEGKWPLYISMDGRKERDYAFMEPSHSF